MNGTPAPKSPKEYVEMIKAGKFIFGKAYLNEDGSWRDDSDHPYFYESISRFIHWEDPALKPDQAGYDAAEKLMDSAWKDAQRTIRIGTPTEGRKALEEFEAKSFH